MSIFKKVSACALALLMIFALAVVTFGAEAEPTKSVTVTFSIPSVYGVDGYFEYSNKALFSGITYRNNSSLVGDISNDRVMIYGSNETNVILEVVVTIKSDAKAGDKCDIKLTYETSNVDGDVSAWKTQTQTVTVEAPSVPETTKAPETQKPTPVTEKPTPQTTKRDEPQPVNPVDTEGPGVDYTELMRQINIAKSLNEEEYSIDSWDAMLKAFNSANKLTSSRKQSEVDNGASALEKAIGELVKIDYDGLRKSVDAAKLLGNIPVHSELWQKLADALARANEAFASRNQEEIDALAKEISDLVDQVKKDSESIGGEVKEIVREVEVLPSGEYCNKHIHTVWLVIMIISLVINLILIALIVWFLLKKKKNQKDDTPLVDYDIGDDE